MTPGLERFRVVGRGGYSMVYVADEPALGREVAVKILLAGFADDSWDRFERECRSAGALSGHPDVVTVLRTGRTWAGAGYLVMEYLPGGSLASYLAAWGPLTPGQTARVGRSVAAALVAAETLGIVHRDVKPENVLLTSSGSAKLGDFGIAGFVAGTAHAATTRQPFTPDHVAPEVLDGQPATTSSDVFSCCSTLHQLLAGTSPHRRHPDEPIGVVIRRKIIEDAPPLPDAVPPTLAGLIAAGLARAPHDRPSISELHGELRRLADALGSDDLWSIGRAPRPLTAPVVASPLDELTATSYPTLPAAPRPGHERTDEPAHDTGRRARTARVALVAVGATVVVAAGLAWAAVAQHQDRTADASATTTATAVTSGPTSPPPTEAATTTAAGAVTTTTSSVPDAAATTSAAATTGTSSDPATLAATTSAPRPQATIAATPATAATTPATASPAAAPTTATPATIAVTPTTAAVTTTTAPATTVAATTSTTVPRPAFSKGNFNGDTRIDCADYAILMSVYGTNSPLADANGDGRSDIFDLSIMSSNWSPGAPTTC